MSLPTMSLLSRNTFIVALTAALISVAVACGDDDPTPTPTSSAGGQQPTATTEPPTATSTNVPAPMPTGTQPTVTPGGAATATQVDPVTPTTTPTPPTTPVTVTPSPTAAPAPTNTPTVSPPTATPNVQFTPGVLNTVELVAGMDNTLYQSSIGATSNGSGTGLFVGKTNNNSLRRALVWFDIGSVVPAGATIESVELRLTMDRTATGSEPVLVHRVTSLWGEGESDAAANEGRGANAEPGDATWLHGISPDVMWQNEGGDFVSTVSAQTAVQGTGDYSWGSTPELVADVQGWIEDLNSNFGWILVGDEANMKTAKRFASSEHPDESTRPTLVISFTPPS